MIAHFDREPIRVHPHDLLKPRRNRCLDIFLREFHKRPRRMKALSPYGFLLHHMVVIDARRRLIFVLQINWERPPVLRFASAIFCLKLSGRMSVQISLT